MLVAIHRESGRRWLIRNVKQDFHTHLGVIPKRKLKPGSVELNGQAFTLFRAGFSDQLRGMKRRAQIITRKDLGFIIAWCGLGRDSVVVESGAGSGGATLVLANLCKKLYSYEIEQENIDVVKHNLKALGLKNASITKADFYDASKVRSHKADLVLLDLPEPWRAYDSVKKVSSIGAYAVAYTPTIVQAAQFAANLPAEFVHERTLELIDRDWKLQGQAVRPVNAPIGHTGFLTICRRVA